MLQVKLRPARFAPEVHVQIDDALATSGQTCHLAEGLKAHAVLQPLLSDTKVGERQIRRVMEHQLDRVEVGAIETLLAREAVLDIQPASIREVQQGEREQLALIYGGR